MTAKVRFFFDIPMRDAKKYAKSFVSQRCRLRYQTLHATLSLDPSQVEKQPT